MSSLELKVPPPAVALLLGVLMWLASSLVAPVEVPFGPRVAVALVLASVGLVVGLAGMVSFWRAKTTINPTKPTATSSLVTSGAFRFTRNPMYLSLLSSLFGPEYAAYREGEGSPVAVRHNPSIERTNNGKPLFAAHVER